MEKFWSDDFDMDLLKIIPETPKILGATAARKVWTVGSTTYGRLNHPVVWNTHGAFLWLEKPNLPRDAYGWVNIHGCVCNKPEVECTWLEFLRDMWAHHFDVMVLPFQIRLCGYHWEPFERITWNRRGWDNQDVDMYLKSARLWLRTINELFNSCRAGQ